MDRLFSFLLRNKSVFSFKNRSRTNGKRAFLLYNYQVDNYIKEMHVFHLCPNMISFGGIQRF